MFGGGSVQGGFTMVSSNSYFQCQGMANGLCWLVEFNTVQEQPGSAWTVPGYYAFVQDEAQNNPPPLNSGSRAGQSPPRTPTWVTSATPRRNSRTASSPAACS